MKRTGVHFMFLCFVLIGAEYSHSEKFACPFPFGTYIHPKDCRRYYLCIFDKPRTMSCDSSKLYDEYKGECAEKSSVDCGDRTGGVTTKGTTPAPGQKTTNEVKTTSKKVEKFKCPYTWGTFPNPNDCTQYYLCLNKRHTLKKCKPTQLYDTKKNECRDEDEVDCGSRFNPREKTTEPPKTTAATEESTSTIFEESTTESSSGNTSDEGEIESSTSIEVSPSSGIKTTLTDESEITIGEITSEEPTQFTKEPEITDGDSSETDEPQSTTEKHEITDEDTSDTDEPQPSSEKPIITDENTSDSNESEPTSENPRITDDTTLDTKITELTSEKSEIVDYTSENDNFKPTSDKPEITDNDVSEKPEITDENTLGTSKSEPSSELPIITDGLTSDSSISQDPDSKSTTPGKLGTTDNGSDHSEELVTTVEDNLSKEPHTTENVRTSERETPPKESEAPVVETTPSTELRSSLPDDKTVSDEDNSTYGEEKTDYTTEETNTSFQPESTADTDEMTGTSTQSESTAEKKITPEVSEGTAHITEISSSSDDVETSPTTSSESPESFECPRKKGNFPHKDCSMYYACRDGSYTIEQCPSGTLFDSVNGMCYNEEDVDCEDRTRPDRVKLSTVAYTSSASPTDRPMTETVSDNDISSEFSKSFDNTDKTVDYTSSEISEMKSTSDYNTRKTEGTSYFDSTTGSTENFETPHSSETDGKVGTESVTDYETFKTSTGDEAVDTSESRSTLIFSTQGTGDSSSSSAISTENYSTSDASESFGTADYVTNDGISSTDQENVETSPDYSSEESTSNYSTEATSETDTAVNYSIEDTSYRTQDEISVESTTDFIKDELSTQSITEDNEHQRTSEVTESETGDSSTDGQSTSFISETIYSDSPTTDYTDVSITDTDVASETHNIEETTSSRTGDDEISTKNIATLRTGEPSTQETDDDGTSHHISSVGTTVEETINDLTTSVLPISTTEEDTSLSPGTTHPNSDKPIVSEITVTESNESSKTTQNYFPSSNEITPTTDTTHLPEEITVSTVRPKEICPATDKTCIVDEDGNVFRCPKSHGHFPHPWDASKFLHCDNFRIHVIDCPTGLRFDPQYNICTWAAAATTKE